jgi:single-stranded-DNA-specific exonuclease
MSGSLLTVKKTILQRSYQPPADRPLQHLHPVLQRVYYARQVAAADELDLSLNTLPPPALLSGMDGMADFLAEAVMAGRRLLVVADFDADGATACVVALRGLRLLGASQVDYLVPTRADGYGLTPEIVALAAERRPYAIITVDNGIASLEGVAAAKALGIHVLVTDHHLPGSVLPEADAIVNPNLAGDAFPSKALAGVGVMFYVLIAVRAKLKAAGWFERRGEALPNLGCLLDLVALGTVADVVPLDRINRVLVHQGVQRIRAGQGHAGVVALLEVAKRDPAQLRAADLGFYAAPRLNAAGRLEDMALGIECLLADDLDAARGMAARLDSLNLERRAIEEQMKEQALQIMKQGRWQELTGQQPVVCLYDASWHQGVIGILASRIKDRLQRPVIAFAPGGEGEIKGSARSVAGVHIRDLLSEVAASHPNLLQKFGGHAMAAGLTIKRGDYSAFVAALEEVAQRHLQDWRAENVVYTDGPLEHGDFLLQFAETLQQAGPWGQGFPEPAFDGVFAVEQMKIMADKHLRLVLALPETGRRVDGVAFNVDTPSQWLGCERLRLAYRLDVNVFRNARSLQLLVDYMEPC